MARLLDPMPHVPRWVVILLYIFAVPYFLFRSGKLFVPPRET